MERAERMILLGVGFLSPLFLVPVLWVMLALTLLTAVGRFVKVWRLAEAPVPVAAPGAIVAHVPPARRPQDHHLAVPLAGSASGRAVQPVRSDLAGPPRPTGLTAAHGTPAHLTRSGD